MPSIIGLFYGSSTCYTEIAAEKIAATLERLTGKACVELRNIADTPIDSMGDFEFLILGIPTWDYGELQEDWEAVWSALENRDFSGKTVALYGLGDQLGYPDWFQDALGYLWAVVVNGGARVVGKWPVEGYDFNSSKALSDDGRHFVGLALDDENEFALSDERIDRWCRQILDESGFAAK